MCGLGDLSDNDQSRGTPRRELDAAFPYGSRSWLERFLVDRPNPLIAAESCTNGIFNSLYFMDVQLSLLRIGRRSPRSDILNDLHDRAVYFAVRQFFVSC